MKLQVLFAALMILMFWSCRNCAQTNKKALILGTWKEVLDNTRFPFNSNAKRGYQFFENNRCENKRGYFKRSKNKALFLGNFTKYILKKDSLKIYDLSQSRWIAMSLLYINSDTLRLKDPEGKVIQYERVQLPSISGFSFDQIILSSSGCFGECPVESISVAKDGDVLYHGEHFTDLSGSYTGKIRPSEFEKLAKKFETVDIQLMKENYASHWTDDETITVTFISKGKIVKTISDYGRAAPTEFIWAYTPVRYLDTQLHLDSIVTNRFNLDVWSLSFVMGDKRMDLNVTEKIYLWGLLQKAKETKATFQKRYALRFRGTNTPFKVETDGQFFEYTLQNGQKVTYDIGFNFIFRNGTRLKFQ